MVEKFQSFYVISDKKGDYKNFESMKKLLQKDVYVEDK